MALLLFLLLLLSGAILAGADTTAPAVTLTVCGHNQAQNAETFDVSFVQAMELIYQSITTTGFGASVSGNGSNTVYGLGQCFDYLSTLGCQLCYAQSRVKLPGCLPAVDSRIYLEGCFLRYADHNVSGDATDASDAKVCGNSTLASLNSTGPRNYLTEFVKNLTDGAAAGGGGNYSRYYKAGSVVLPTAGGERVYGMAQCWKSLNASACGDCLKAARESVVGCMPDSDGKALNAGCYVRYSTDPFYLEDLAAGGGGSSSARRRLAVALGSTFTALAVVGIAVFLVRRGSRDSNDDQYGSTEIIRTIAASHLSYKYEDIIKATDGFNQINKLGQGGYGSVYKGVLQDGREIAVKRLFINTRQWVDQFFNEVTLINQVQHKNLVKLFGCSVEGPESLLIYEYLCNTSLEKFLFDSFKKGELDWERRFDIMVGTAEGLAYLHGSSEIRIIHRDIKASNILLDEKFKPKIADFGLARYFAEDQSHLSTGLAGTFGYMAPEYIVHGQLTEKADVYSYGVLVLEIITGRKNQNSVSTSAEGHSLIASIWQHFSSKTVGKLLDPNLQDQCSEEQALRVFHVGLLCVQASPSLRPPMWKVVEMLTGGSKDLPLPTQPPFINVKGTGSSGEGSEASYATSSSKSPFSMNQLSITVSEGRQAVGIELDSSDNQRLHITDDKERGKTQISIRPKESQPHR